MTAGWKDLVDEFVKEFEDENPNIKVNLSILEWGDAYQKAITAAGAGQLPDVWMTNYTWNAAFIDLGVVQPIDDFLTQDFVDQFFPTMFDLGVKRDGQTYGLVNGAATRGLYFNREIFREAEITTPPATYDELVDAASRIAQLDDRWGYVLQAKGVQGEQDFTWRLWSLGGDLVTADGKPGINTAQGYDAMQFVVDIVDQGLTQPSVLETAYEQKIQSFKTGKAGLMIDGSWWMGDLAGTALDWGTAPVPAGSQAFNHLVTNCYLMNANAVDKEAAWKLMSKTAEDKWALRRDKKISFPAIKRTYAEDAFYSDARWRSFFANLDKTKFQPGDLTNWQAMVDELLVQQQLAILGDKTPTQAVDATASKWAELLES